LGHLSLVTRFLTLSWIVTKLSGELTSGTQLGPSSHLRTEPHVLFLTRLCIRHDLDAVDPRITAKIDQPFGKENLLQTFVSEAVLCHVLLSLWKLGHLCGDDSPGIHCAPPAVLCLSFEISFPTMGMCHSKWPEDLILPGKSRQKLTSVESLL